jgi:hypothetical protein
MRKLNNLLRKSAGTYGHIAVAAVIFLLFSNTCGQNRYEGYSVVVDATMEGTCPVWYLPSVGNGNAIDVYLAGTDLRQTAGSLTACDGASVRGGNQVFPNGDGRWCFNGAEEMYEIKFRNGANYLWYPVTKNTGFYNVKDFRPVTRTSGPTPTYTFTDPADYTRTIRNAIAYIAVRQGGTLRFPDGDYVVGTLDGNRRDSNFQAITLPSGIVIEGASWNSSLPTTNVPLKTGATRIRLRNPNQSIFRIGGCTNHVTIRNLELLGNSALYGEMPRDQVGTYGIEGLGKWIIQANGNQSPNSSQGLKVENVIFQNLDRGIYVHNANDERCRSAEQNCGGWQFDYVLVDHGIFLNNRTGIWVDTYNTDWKITNSFLAYAAANAPGDGIRVKKAGSMLIEQTFGGGYDYGTGIGGTFLFIDTIGSLTMIGSAAERNQRSIYTNPAGSISSMMLTTVGNVFGDKLELHGRLNFVSSGNFFAANNVIADPTVTLTSVGDRYCYDSTILPGRCVDASGRNVANPGISGGRRMFETGRVGEDTGPNRIEGRPNFFGYNVQIGDGLLQFDPNITFTDTIKWAAGQGTRPRAEDGALVYCKDCRRDGSGLCSQGRVGSDGAFAKRINGQWRCD